MLSTPILLSTEPRQKQSLTQGVIPFLNSIVFQYTNPLPFETEPHIIHTISLAREHCDSYSYYIQNKTLEMTPSQTSFQIIFNSVPTKTQEYFIEHFIQKLQQYIFKMFLLPIWKNL